MAGPLILREFLVDRQTPFFVDFIRRFTDLPFLVTLTERDGAHVPGRFLTAADLPEHDLPEEAAAHEAPEWKPVLVDAGTGRVVVPGGSLGFRYTDSGTGRWNLDLGEVRPRLSLLEDPETAGAATVLLPRFDAPDGHGTVLHRGVPVRRMDRTCHHGVRPGPGPVRCTGTRPAGGLRVRRPYRAVHPAWQESITR